MLVTRVGEASPDALDTPVGEALARLQTARLVTVDGQDVELTDRGRHWCVRGLQAGMPADTEAEPMAGARYAVLDLIGRYLDATAACYRAEKLKVVRFLINLVEAGNIPLRHWCYGLSIM